MTGAGPRLRRRVAVVEDHHLIGAALAAALRHEGYEVVVPALTSLEDLSRSLETERPDVVLLDLDLGRIGRAHGVIGPAGRAGAAVIIVSALADPASIGHALAEGAVGWLPKTGSLPHLMEAVQAALDGRPIMAAGDRQDLLDEWWRERRAAEAARAPFERLSPKEAEVLRALVDGRTVERIASEFFVAPSTVRSHVRAILFKLGVNSQLEAVAAATRSGWGPDPAN